MTSSRSARTRARIAGLLAVVAALAASLGYQSAASSSPPRPAALLPVAAAPAPPPRAPSTALDPSLVRALRRAAADAAADGVRLEVTSGRRSPEHQEQLFREAVERYGSAEEAARWVATPETSAHVAGDAVDVEAAAAAWLAARGAAYGLCRIYANEPWHFELRPVAVAEGCPPMYADPSQDPRMRP